MKDNEKIKKTTKENPLKNGFDVEWIKDHLEPGEIQKIAEDMTVSMSMAYKTLNVNCREFSYDYVLACHKVATERAKLIIAAREQDKIIKEKLATL